MVNLLFISNSTKIDAIRNALQPLLKVKIDIVGDFDYGLKDVFEKRPATVFIQDQIAGVTGESVARHIQMLLGAGAPSFIFMYEGSTKANPIKGLFDYLIDLSQAESTIVADIQATLKSLLGASQWEKIYIPPKIVVTEIKETDVVPEGSRTFADKLVDDFLTDLDNSGPESAEIKFKATDLSPQMMPAEDVFEVVSSPQDQLAEMVSEAIKYKSKIEEASDSEDTLLSDISAVPAYRKETDRQNQKSAPLENQKASESVAPPAITQSQALLKEIAPSVSPDLHLLNNGSGTSARQPVLGNPSNQIASPADFIISGEKQSADVASEELLRVFEANYSFRSSSWKRFAPIAAVLTICAGGCLWYLLNQNPRILADQSKPAALAPPVATAPVTRPVEPEILAQKPVSPPTLKDKVNELPTFIPLAGLDSSYSTLKPGWERYIDSTMEYRIFRSAGKIKALQVLGIHNHDISEPKLKSILTELLGDSEYHVKSREQKQGYKLSRASLGQKAELLMYHNNSTLRAFVVSLD